MKKTAILVSAALLASGTAAIAADKETEGAKDAKEEKRICKTEKVTGSLTRVRRTCLTQREWDRLAEITRRNVNELERDANQSEALTNRSFNGPSGS